jgi:hypothetical protein
VAGEQEMHVLLPSSPRYITLSYELYINPDLTG